MAPQFLILGGTGRIGSQIAADLLANTAASCHALKTQARRGN